MKSMIAALMLAVCVPAMAEKPQMTEPQLVAQQTLSLGADLLNKAEDGNVVLSPLSINAAFSMATVGAKGETADQLRKRFLINSPKPHDAAGQVLAGLIGEGESGDQLQIANHLWVQRGYAIEPAFAKTLQQAYQAAPQVLDFSTDPAAARKTINDEVLARTGKKIADLLPESAVTTDTRLVLTNAVYLKASWAKPFVKELTQDAPFTPKDAKPVNVPMMRQSEKLPYADTADATLVELPYAERNLSLVIVLPKAGKDAAAALAKLNQTALERRKVNLALPKFKVESSMDLVTALKPMIPLPFDANKADFTGITTHERLYIGAAVHRAVIEVNETGTEAAAATAVTMQPLSVDLDETPPVDVTVDRPFLFVLREQQNGTVVFIGRVNNPK